MLVKSEDKKGNIIKTIEFVPVYSAKYYEEHKDELLNYCVNDLGLKNPEILIPKIKIDTLFKIDGFPMHLSGRTGNQLVFKGAVQLILDYEEEQLLKRIEKFLNDLTLADISIGDMEGRNK